MSILKRIALACVPLLALSLAPVGMAFAQVKVTAATPSSAYQGTIALDVVVSGSGFNSSAKVQYFVSGTTNPGGITVKKVTFRSSSELVTTIDVAEFPDFVAHAESGDLVRHVLELERGVEGELDSRVEHRVPVSSELTAGRRRSSRSDDGLRCGRGSAGRFWWRRSRRRVPVLWQYGRMPVTAIT